MTCPYCHLYHDIKQACEVCGATAIATQSTARGKASSSWLTQLHAAGMSDDSAIVAGLRTGAVVQAIGSEKNYQHAIDYLVSRGYEVAGYRARIVCGGQWA